MTVTELREKGRNNKRAVKDSTKETKNQITWQ